MIGWSNVCVTLRLGLSGVIAFLSISLFNRSGIFMFLSGFLLSMSEFTTFASDLSPYMSRATTISMKSEKNKKSSVPHKRDEAYARGSTLLPSDLHKVRRSSRLANGLGTGERLSLSLLSR